jgi:hypothetical protein
MSEITNSEVIKLNDILRIDHEDLKNTKIRFHKTNSKDKSNDPLEEYIENPELVTKKWFLYKQEDQGRPFRIGNLGLGFLYLDNDKWLFITAGKITKELGIVEAGVFYEAEDVEEYSKYFGRIIVKYKNTSQQFIRKAIGPDSDDADFIDKLEVLEILSTRYDGESFPGYDKVTLSWQQLHTIIARQKKDWVAALSNQKGIYLITDKQNGKHYVGSASGEYMILQRWENYIKDGHGGDVELKELLKKEGFEYIKNNFQYSILETFSRNTDIELISARESWWKEAIKSRTEKLGGFGYNAN